MNNVQNEAELTGELNPEQSSRDDLVWILAQLKDSILHWLSDDAKFRHEFFMRLHSYSKEEEFWLERYMNEHARSRVLSNSNYLEELKDHLEAFHAGDDTSEEVLRLLAIRQERKRKEELLSQLD